MKVPGDVVVLVGSPDHGVSLLRAAIVKLKQEPAAMSKPPATPKADALRQLRERKADTQNLRNREAAKRAKVKSKPSVRPAGRGR